uniref:DUF1294 domain-containing protein n=1 Tax=Paenibacillus sp. J5C2022 TaxID=2977129 RepID=UPI0021D3EAA2|nr:DUF1294 domain-containing protein [Paenibacillus sp. J5C2022]MCU6707226.1 DUF1294 domain-containing protein [Paenibacillus sp. J5C2022]
MIYYVIIGAIVILNVYTFLLMGWDKKSAKLKRRRTPEKRLFLLSAVGGAAGTLWGMKVWRHKTQHRSFTVGIPFLLALHLIVVILITGYWVMSSGALQQ